MKTLTLPPGHQQALLEAAGVHYGRWETQIPNQRMLALHLIRIGCEAIVRDNCGTLRNLAAVEFRDYTPEEAMVLNTEHELNRFAKAENERGGEKEQ